jgi:hypothetical protein
MVINKYFKYLLFGYLCNFFIINLISATKMLSRACPETRDFQIGAAGRAKAGRGG